MDRIRLLILVVLLVSCSSKQETVTHINGQAMTMAYRILIGKALTKAEQQRIEALIAETFAHVDATFNRYNPDSELTRLNQAPGGVPLPLSHDMEELIRLSGEMVALTDGRFDPTIFSAHKMWMAHLAEGTLPDADELSQFVGWENLHLADHNLWKAYDAVEMDFGAIAKGLAVDRLVAALQAGGFPDLYVEWGGEIRAAGQHPEGRPWTVFISRLTDTNPDHAIDFVALQDSAIATSGDYLQQWTVGDITYTHILDPKTCTPLQTGGRTPTSVTCQAATCAVADALATALMLTHSPEEAKAVAAAIQERHPDISFWVIHNPEIISDQVCSE